MAKSTGFFRVELPVLKAAHRLGAGPLGAYLIMAAGTGADHRTTRWSAVAVGKYGGCRNRAAREHITALRAAGLIQQTRGGQRPAYELPTFREMKLEEAERQGAKMRTELLSAEGLELVLKGRRQTLAEQMAGEGLVSEVGPGRFEPRDPPLCWLPSSLILGAGSEMPPLKRLVMGGRADQLYLLAALYHFQTLPEFGGIDPGLVWSAYNAELIHDGGEFCFWEFNPSGYRHIDPTLGDDSVFAPLTEDGPKRYRRIWDALSGLEEEGLLATVPTLFAGDPSSAPVMHPLDGDLAEAASNAARAMLLESRARQVEGILVPVPREISAPQVAAVFRLHYRAHTDMTKAWIARERDRRPEWIKRYQDLETQGEEQSAARSMR